MLVHLPSKSLVLKLRNPARVTEVIPNSRVVEKDGQKLTQVKYGLDEVKVLNNLGIKAPSPINYFYDWQGKFKPFSHQRETSAFFTLNPRSICLNDMGCVDATTEYLSPTGWRRMDDYDGGQVAQYHPDSGNIEFVEPTEYVKKPCPEMIRFKTSRGVDQLLSPEHRVLYVTSTGEWQVRNAAEIEHRHHAAKYGWKGRFITTFAAPEQRGLKLSDAELRLQVALIADGHFPNRSKAVSVRLKKERKAVRIVHLLREAGVAYKVRESGEYHVFRFQAPWRTKEFGSEFWQATQDQLQIVADECVHWDGSVRKAGGVAFFSTSKASADFIQYAFSATGRTASMSEDARKGRATCYGVHARGKAALLYLTGQKADKTKSESVWREPSPDGYKYCFMVPSTFLLLRRNGCIFATGNTGKTLSVLWAADYLMSLGKIRKAIIVCPKSVMSVWENELHSHFLFSRRCVVLHGAKARRLKMLEQDVPFYIINHDGIKTIEKELKAKGFDLWVIDEAAAFRNAQSNRSKCLNRLITDVFWMWMLTGTPCPTLPTDAWALGRMLRSPLAPKYFSNFKSQVMTQVTPFKWVPKPDAYATAYAVLQPGVRYKKEDCIDLPPVTFQHYDCDQTKEQKDAFKEMQKELVMDVGGNKITAANAGVKLNKLLQVCCGEVYDNNGNATTINSLNRLQTCNEIVEQARHKVLVFVPFTAALNQVANYLRKKGHSVAVVDGRTSVGKRKKIFDDFQNTDEPRVLVAHPQTTAHGLTLTRADTTIWYVPIFSLEIFEQANNRMSRPGQKNKMTVAMICSSWLERKVYEALENKAHMQNSVLELYKKAANAPA